jgi:hypothetical protein
MVKFLNKTRTILLFILVAYRMIKFAIVLGYSSDEKARQLITRSRWRISKHKDKNVREKILDFIKQMEEARFPNEK